jgi:hypothetical protein
VVFPHHCDASVDEETVELHDLAVEIATLACANLKLCFNVWDTCMCIQTDV